VTLAALLAAGPLSEGIAAEEEPKPESERAHSAEDDFEESFQKFEARVLEMRENSQRDEVVLAEAEEIAAVADEMRDEGDLETAISLLEEALGLLEHSPSYD
jgi:hypothetical protein